MLFSHGTLARRDALLLLLGASLMIWSLLSGPMVLPDHPIMIIPHFQQPNTVTKTAIVHKAMTQLLTPTQTQTAMQTVPKISTETGYPKSRVILPSDELPQTVLLAHAPGWTLFRNLYMSNDTMFIVADEKGRQTFPEIRMITSTGLAWTTPENTAMREPTDENMRIITPQEAKDRWVGVVRGGKGNVVNRVWTVEGNTLLLNDPSQFLRFYYYFVAELFLGAQAFWHGAFSAPISPAEALTASSHTHFSLSHPAVPPIHRAIFAHSNANGWRDRAGFNAYFLRAAFPSLVVEHQEDWDDRIVLTRSTADQPERAWHFPIVLFTDRSAAHRGKMCGSATQHTASEAWDYMRLNGKLRGIHIGGWWAPLREAVWRFANAPEGIPSPSVTKARAVDDKQMPMHFVSETGEVLGLSGSATKLDPARVVDVGPENQKLLPMPEKIVITYISRQDVGYRSLIPRDHDELVKSMKGLVERKNKDRLDFIMAGDDVITGDENERKREVEEQIPPEWEFHELLAWQMTKDDEVKAAARTTIMLGVHAYGLTHLVFMQPNRVSTVIEIFYPKGFAHDHYWTTRSLGMTHVTVWNDTTYTHPHKPGVYYPEGFRGNAIPVHGPTIAKLIEDRVSGKV